MRELILITIFFGLFGYASFELFKELATVKTNVEKIVLDSYTHRGE